MSSTTSICIGTNLRPRQEALLVALRLSNLAVLEKAGWVKSAASALVSPETNTGGKVQLQVRDLARR